MKKNIQKTKTSRPEALVKKALSMANELENQLQAELKFHDVKALSADVTDAGVITPLSNVAEGTGVGQRVGDSVLVKSCRVRVIFGYNTTLGGSQPVRVIIFNNKSNKVVDATGAQYLLDDYNSVYGPISPVAYDYRQRTTILYDKLVTLTSTSPVRFFDIKLDNLDIPLQFDGTTGDQITNGLTMAVISDVTSGLDFPQFMYCSRCIFTDQ